MKGNGKERKGKKKDSEIFIVYVIFTINWWCIFQR